MLQIRSGSQFKQIEAKIVRLVQVQNWLRVDAFGVVFEASVIWLPDPRVLLNVREQNPFSAAVSRARYGCNLLTREEVVEVDAQSLARLMYSQRAEFRTDYEDQEIKLWCDISSRKIWGPIRSFKRFSRQSGLTDSGSKLN